MVKTKVKEIKNLEPQPFFYIVFNKINPYGY